MTEEIKGRLILRSTEAAEDVKETTVDRFPCVFRQNESGEWLIKYDDTKNGSRVVIRLSKNKAEVLRKGEQSGLMMKIIPGKTTNSRVRTAMGEFSVDTKGVAVRHTLTGKGGEVTLKYSHGDMLTISMTITAVQQ